jgi:hypothetical protein
MKFAVHRFLSASENTTYQLPDGTIVNVRYVQHTHMLTRSFELQGQYDIVALPEEKLFIPIDAAQSRSRKRPHSQLAPQPSQVRQ